MSGNNSADDIGEKAAELYNAFLNLIPISKNY
jgi:hypothetical protein